MQGSVKGAGEMSQSLRALAAIIVDIGLVPRTT